jgi:hypothetical protein
MIVGDIKNNKLIHEWSLVLSAISHAIMDRVKFLPRISVKVILCDTSLLEIPVGVLLTATKETLAAMSYKKKSRAHIIYQPVLHTCKPMPNYNSVSL